MRIKKTELICGHAAADVRTLMRRWQFPSGGHGLIRATLNVPDGEVKGIVEALQAEGFIERAAKAFPPDPIQFERTVKGAALAMASAARPVHRSLVQTRLHELIVRMEKVNEDPEFLVGVQEAAVFGSYLTSAERLGDLDVSYKTYRKIEDGTAFVEASQRAAQASGRQFSNFMESLFWPERQLQLFLKNRSRVYSLANEEALLQDPTVPRRVIFNDRRPVPDWKSL
jgi:hypothetical protein